MRRDRHDAAQITAHAGATTQTAARRCLCLAAPRLVELEHVAPGTVDAPNSGVFRKRDFHKDTRVRLRSKRECIRRALRARATRQRLRDVNSRGAKCLFPNGRNWTFCDQRERALKCVLERPN